MRTFDSGTIENSSLQFLQAVNNLTILRYEILQNLTQLAKSKPNIKIGIYLEYCFFTF